MMSLEHNKFGVKLVFVLKVTADLDIEPNNIVDIIANEIRIRKNYDGFSVSEFEMDYVVHKDKEMIDV